MPPETDHGELAGHAPDYHGAHRYAFCYSHYLGRIAMLVPRSAFALASITDTGSLRYALGSVRFERDGDDKPLAMATDGRKFVVLGWSENDKDCYPPLPGINAGATLDRGNALLIPAAACKEAAKFKVAVRLLNAHPVLENSVVEETALDPGQLVTIGATDGTAQSVAHVVQAEGRFPKWQDIIPATSAASSHSVTLDADHLLAMLEVIRKHVTHSDGYNPVVLTLDAANPCNSPVTLTARNADGRTACGVLMPMSDGRNGDTLGTNGSRYHRHPGPVWSPVEHTTAAIERAEQAASVAFGTLFENARTPDGV
jgi:hypothetical protein